MLYLNANENSSVCYIYQLEIIIEAQHKSLVYESVTIVSDAQTSLHTSKLGSVSDVP